ncbi:hypothetical protein FB451DRAFT_404445 [Mycena latifolia]|nr:hypothetical protein FB451DRAFT_404445 [Mycena latifolia]
MLLFEGLMSVMPFGASLQLHAVLRAVADRPAHACTVRSYLQPDAPRVARDLDLVARLPRPLPADSRRAHRPTYHWTRRDGVFLSGPLFLVLVMTYWGCRRSCYCLGCSLCCSVTSSAASDAPRPSRGRLFVISLFLDLALAVVTPPLPLLPCHTKRHV